MNNIFAIVSHPAFNLQVALACCYHPSLRQINIYRSSIFRHRHPNVLEDQIGRRLAFLCQHENGRLSLSGEGFGFPCSSEGNLIVAGFEK